MTHYFVKISFEVTIVSVGGHAHESAVTELKLLSD